MNQAVAQLELRESALASVGREEDLMLHERAIIKRLYAGFTV